MTAIRSLSYAHPPKSGHSASDVQNVAPSAMPSRLDLLRSPLFLLLLVVLAVGAWFRLPGEKHRARKGSDEAYYEQYVTQLDTTGVFGWPDLVSAYTARQKTEQYAFLPPTRVLFLGSAHAWRVVTGASAIEAVRWVSFAAGVATLLLGAAFAWRLGGLAHSVGITALIASAPLLIHLSHRALIDGFFALWALLAVWGLWECLRAPDRRGWLAIYGIGLGAMVLTKENAAFAFVALVAILALNRWLKIGRITPALLIVTFAAPAFAALLLVAAAGGLSPLLEAYRLNVQKSVILPYAIATGDGPWHRYLLDFVLISPAVTLLAVTALGGTGWSDPAKRYFAVFVVVSYALMAQVRYGMNLRYGAMWEFPLCWLAYSMLASLAARTPQRIRTWTLTALVAIVCATEFQNYYRLFVASDIYDPVSGAMTQPLEMFKRQPAARPTER